MSVDDFWKDAELIYSYSRAQAIADGVLVDISTLAKEAGFHCPMAVTAAVWAEVIEPDERAKSNGQSATGRLWDMLNLLRHAIRKAEGDKPELLFTMLVARGGKVRPERVELKSLAGPGDNAELVITVMLPHED